MWQVSRTGPKFPGRLVEKVGLNGACRQKRPTNPAPESRKVGLNRAKAEERADRITVKPGRSRPKTSKRDEKGRRNHREAGRK